MTRYIYNKPMKKDKKTLVIYAGIVILWILLMASFWRLVNLFFEWAIRISGEV
jgi:hypothetical protein